MNDMLKKYLFALSLAIFIYSTLVSGAVSPEDYYTEPQVYGFRPNPNYECDLGPIGASGIMARIYRDVAVTVEETIADTPADGKFKKGDIIVGLNGQLLKGRNPMVVLGKELTRAEETDGVLAFEVKDGKDGAVRKVTINIPVLGGYSDTFPLNCRKSKKIIEQAAKFYAGKDRLKSHDLHNALACLFLLSTGDDAYVPRVKEYFSQFLNKDGSVRGLADNSWYNGYNGVACAEYYLRTGDKSVLPILQHYCDDARDRQAYGIGWGHWGYGVNPAYEAGGGMQHAAGNQILLTLVLGKMSGVDVDDKTLLGALKHWYRFAGHGAIPIADQRYWHIFRSAGRDGATAAVMQAASLAEGDTCIYKEAAEYLSMSALTSWPERNYNWEVIWHSISGANVLEFDPDLYHKTQKRFTWNYNLRRMPSGAFYAHSDHATMKPVDAGVSLALAYTAPLKNLAIQGGRSKYAKKFTLPDYLWGTEADRAFLSVKHNKDFKRYGKDDEIHVLFRQLPLRLQYSRGDVKDLTLDMMLKNVRHWRCSVRIGAAKALCMNKHYGELEKLLRDPDPRLRRAALDGINDCGPWFTGLPVGRHALKSEDYTPAMCKAITKILRDPKEAWFVKDAAMLALYHGPTELVKKNISYVLPWTTHEDWWLRESAFLALMGLEKDDALFVKYLPTMADILTNEYRHNPRTHMIRAFEETLAKSGNDSPAGKLIIAGLLRATMEGKVVPDVGKNPHSKIGMSNIIQVALVSIQKAPETAAELAEALVKGGRLKELDTNNLMTILKAPDGHISDRYVGLYPAIKIQTPEKKKRLTDIIYNDFRPLLIERLASIKDKGTESKLIDLIIDLNRLKKSVAGWQAIGNPKPAKRVWRYTSFDPLTEKDVVHPRVWERFRTATLPKGKEDWFKPGFDDSKWQSGTMPIGKGNFIAHGHGRGWTATPDFYFKNNSAWGKGEFLLTRTTFNVTDTELDYDYYRIWLLTAKGYSIYLNGNKIRSYPWSSHFPRYEKLLLTKAERKHLKKGANTLAVYCIAGYEKDNKSEEYHPIGQIDISIEGLRKDDLLVDSGCAGASMPWDDPVYRKDIPATQAVCRPVSTGWKLWMKHHEDRKAWVKEPGVNLIMVGDSIVFRWSRNGKKVWDEYYAERNAVNIGSSGDRTQHMLWHFQNGKLEGTNPKLVLLMIGTNNRGEPEKKGADTAYGILALLKEIHKQLPESKVLLMAVFPRGWTPQDKGRIRNNQINDIIRTYADEKTVYWLDIGHVFLDENGGLIKELMPDSLHPSEEGFRVWAEAMEPTIKKLLGEQD